MSRSSLILLAVMLFGGQAFAQTPAPNGKTFFRFARVVTTDVEKTAKFYEDTLGLREVDRGVSQRSGPYIQLNFGDSIAEAKANPAVRIFIGNAQPGQTPDTVSHLGFYVPDTSAAVARAKIAGGQVAEGPYEVKMADGTRIIAYVKDPAGNQIEILSMKK